MFSRTSIGIDRIYLVAEKFPCTETGTFADAEEHSPVPEIVPEIELPLIVPRNLGVPLQVIPRLVSSIGMSTTKELPLRLP